MTVIWAYWEQGWDEAPQRVLECIASWETKNPDYTVHRLSAQNIGTFLSLTEPETKLLGKLRVQTKSDVYRLMLLKHHGGIWVDATLYCNRPLSDWMTLSADHPVAMFENPGPDRLVSSWFLAALPNAELIDMWLTEFWSFLDGLPDPTTPTGWRKLVQKGLQRVYEKNAKTTLSWWNKLPYQMLSLTPYFIMHYSYNRLYLTNPGFKTLASAKIGFPADTAHIVQFALAGKIAQPNAADISDAYVHKLNWRKLPKNETIADVITRLIQEPRS